MPGWRIPTRVEIERIHPVRSPELSFVRGTDRIESSLDRVAAVIFFTKPDGRNT
jgi:hypothetical protein